MAKRRNSGQFAKGNPGGPGRPKPPAPPLVTSRLPQIGDDHAAILTAMAARDLDAAWLAIQKNFPPRLVIALARDAIARGTPVPAHIADLAREET